jgi:hypothetical protein
MNFPRHQPPPSCHSYAEFVGTVEDIDVWWDPRQREYWYNIPDVANTWTDTGKEPHLDRFKPAFPLAEAHRLLLNQ